ncbi:hypothetical protein LguiB_003160 [Lonicera macranthoides]
MGGNLSESESFFNFIRSIDPKNTLKIQLNELLLNPCSNHLVVVKCNLRANSVIALEEVFFVEEDKSFKLEDLHEAAADLQGQSLYSSLYKVMLNKSSMVFAVKRLKKLQIMLREPLISEYGYSKFLDPKTACLFNSNRYTAPNKSSIKQADVYSFGVILLELLTGKVVEKCGLDLLKWVKSMVREEWTREVFDKEVTKVGLYVFPLLNISLKCVAHFPEHRPFICEVLEKIEEVVNAHDDFSPSFDASIESNQ